MFPSSGEGEKTRTQLRPLEGANLITRLRLAQLRCLSPPHPWMETHPVSETLYFLVSRILHDGQYLKPQ
jgi:hypothetical protein